MGFLAGFGDRDIKMLRRGYCYKISWVPEPFYAEVHAPGYAETWCEGLSVYHNPPAKIGAQADRQSILEHFKEYFAGTRHDVQVRFERELVGDRSGQLYAPG